MLFKLFDQSLDVSDAVELTYLICYNNQLSELDLSNNTKLISLDCHNNQLTSLDITNNTLLRVIRGNNNTINHIKLKVIGNIKIIYAYGSGYIYLDSGTSYLAANAMCYSIPQTGSSLYQWFDGGISRGSNASFLLGNIIRINFDCSV
jgi:hypothetical protein